MKVNHWENLKRSFTLAFKNKWLILIAVFLVSLSANTGNFNNSNNNSYSFNNNFRAPSQAGLINTTNALDNFFSTMKEDSVFGIFLLVVLIISLVILGIIIKIYSTNFAIGNFYYAIKEVDEDRNIDLTELSSISRKKVWDLFIAYLYSGAIFFTIILFIVTLISLSTLDTSGVALGISIVFSVIIGILATISFLFSSIYWEYLVLFRNKKGTEAVNLSFKYSLKFILDNFVMRSIQCLVGCGLGLGALVIYGIVLGILGLVLLAATGIFSISPITLIISLPLILILSLAILSIINVVAGIITLISGIFGYLFNRDILKEEE